VDPKVKVNVALLGPNPLPVTFTEVPGVPEVVPRFITGTILNAELSAAVRVPSTAWSLYPTPARSIVQLERLTTPELSAWVQPERTPGPPVAGVPDVIDNVTVEESLVTGLPN
jgi:hypothetical protein